MKIKQIAIASDHAGFYLKSRLIEYLRNNGYEIKDYGSFSEESVDYPDYGHPLANGVSEGKHDFGISICGTGNGINMTVNKHQNIRSALCWNDEIGKLARSHNDANICALPARFISLAEALLIVNTFLETPFEGGRHLKRIKKIPVKNNY